MKICQGAEYAKDHKMRMKFLGSALLKHSRALTSSLTSLKQNNKNKLTTLPDTVKKWYHPIPSLEEKTEKNTAHRRSLTDKFLKSIKSYSCLNDYFQKIDYKLS